MSKVEPGVLGAEERGDDAVGAASHGLDYDAPAPEIDVSRRPTVIVDNVHVTYRVLVTGKAAARGSVRPWSRTIKGMREIHAVRGVSFATYEGEVVGLV